MTSYADPFRLTSQTTATDGMRIMDAMNRPRRAMPVVTHAQLVTAAARWLRHVQHCGVVLTEVMSSAPEIPDAIGFKSSHSILVECKVSLSDLKGDRDKPSERSGWRMGAHRYYLLHPVLWSKVEARGYEDTPAPWGVLTLNARGRVRVVRKAENSDQSEWGRRCEVRLLVSVLRRYQAQGITYAPIRPLSERRAAYRQAEDDVREARRLMRLEASL